MYGGVGYGRYFGLRYPDPNTNQSHNYIYAFISQYRTQTHIK